MVCFEAGPRLSPEDTDPAIVRGFIALERRGGDLAVELWTCG